MSLISVVSSDELIRQAGVRQQLRDAGLPIRTEPGHDLNEIYLRMEVEEANDKLLKAAAVRRRHNACREAGLL